MFSIGTTLTFCVEALIDEDVYVLTELHPITLPTSVRDIPEFVNDLDRIKDVYLNVMPATPSLDANFWEDNHRHTISTPLLRTIMDKYREKRFCLVDF